MTQVSKHTQSKHIQSKLQVRELVLLSSVLSNKFHNNKYTLRILPNKYIKQEDRGKVGVYSRLSFIQNRKYPSNVQLLETPIEGKEKTVKKVSKVLMKTPAVSVDELIKENEDDTEDTQRSSSNVVEFYIQNLSQQIYQILYDNQIVEKIDNQRNIDQNNAELQNEIDYIHQDYILFILQQKFKNLLTNQYNRSNMLQVQYAIYIIYLILFKTNTIKELEYTDELYTQMKKQLLSTLKELCQKIFDKQLQLEDELNKFETYIGKELLENIDQKILEQSEEQLETEVEDGDLTEPEEL